MYRLISVKYWQGFFHSQKWLTDINQYFCTISEFLLLFTSCRKVLAKMPDSTLRMLQNFIAEQTFFDIYISHQP